MKIVRLLTVMIVLLACVSGGAAFDGERPGFILSGGLGYSPYVHHSQTHDGYTFEESNPGVAFSLELGWGSDANNVLTLGGDGALFTSTLFGDRKANQGFAGFSWYHYFGRQGSSVFSVVGLGSFAFGVEDDYQQPDSVWSDDLQDYEPQAATPRQRGVGAQVGVGVEFAKHWQVGAFLIGGQTKAFDVDIEHLQVNLLVQWMAY